MRAAFGHVSSTKAARNGERFAGDPGRIFGCEEDGSRGDVVGPPDAPQRRLSFSRFAEVTLRNTSALQAFRLHHTWVDRVDANLARALLLCQRPGDRIDGRLRAAVDRSSGDRRMSHDRTDVNDRATGRAKV